MVDSLDPFKSVADYDREEARSAARDDLGPIPPDRADWDDREPSGPEEDGYYHPPSCTRPTFHHEEGLECTP